MAVFNLEIHQLVYKIETQFKGYNYIFEVRQHGKTSAGTLRRQIKWLIKDGSQYRKYL